jgi:hypothetical protein
VSTGAVIAAVAASERRIARQLREAGAVSPETAIALDAGGHLDRRRLASLLDAGAVREAEPGHYWIDEEAWAARGDKRRSLMLIAAIVALIAAVVMAVAAGMRLD